MKIYFCDGCNESIPLPEVQAGEVTTIKGKMFCRNCIPPSSLAGPGAASGGVRAVSAPRAPVAWIVLVVALLAWTAWRDRALILGGGDGVEPATRVTSDPSHETRSRLALLENEMLAVEQRHESLTRELSTVQSALEGARADDEARDKRVASLADEVQRLSVSQSAGSQLVERVQMNANRLGQFELRVDALSEAVAAHEALLDLGTIPPASTSGQAGGASAMLGVSGGGAPKATDPARAAEIEAIRRKLLDPEPDQRFEGVDDVERGTYRELSADLVPLLRDEDMFVRLHAMNVLGNFGYEEAVPALFDTLEDGNASIRKTAAETLVRLTGYDPGFEPKAGSADRAKALKAWREWYAERGS